MKLLSLLVPALLCAQVVKPPASAVFDPDQVHEIRLTFANADWYAQLTNDYDTHPDNTPYRNASLAWGSNKFDSVGVRFKGNSSYRGATTLKKPFRIKLNEFVKGQKIEGMASFGLSNAWNDPSFVREKAYYEMAAAEGLPAARSGFAKLYVNDTYLGLYVLGEIVNGDFLKSHFASGDDGGNLYKAAAPGANLAYQGTSPTSYQTVFSKESNEDADDWTDLIELARVFDQTPTAQLKSVLDPLIDVDSFLTALALDNATVNLDSYVGMAQNYFLYKRSSDKKWVWIPWDPSLAFGALAQNLSSTQMRTLSLEWVQSATGGGFGGGFGGANSGTRPLATKLWQVPEYEARYKVIYRNLMNNVFLPATVIARMNTLRDLIRPAVVADTQKLVTQAQFDAAMTSDSTTSIPGQPGGGAGLGGGIPALTPFIEARVSSVKSQLDGILPVTTTATPVSLLFAQTAGSSASSVQSLAIRLSDSTRTAAFTATSSANWITLSSASGTVPTALNVSASAAGLGVGTQSGAITLTIPSAADSPVSVPVVIRVVDAPSIVANPVSLNLAGNFGGAPGAPTQTIAVASTAGASAFTVTTSSANCTNFLSVTPTSGVTPAVLTVITAASPTGAACTGSIQIASGNLAPATVTVTSSVLPGGGGPGGPGGPVLPAISAVTNAASYAAGAIAPGEILTIFGTNLGPPALVAGAFANGRLATNAGGVQVLFDGTAAPVLYAGSNQVGVIAPFEIGGKSQTVIQVRNNQSSQPTTQLVTPSAPGIFTTAANGNGQAAIVNQNATINAADKPAARGSIVSLYLTGAGLLSPAGITGGVGSSSQLIAQQVSVTIGGVAATVSYAGAAPQSIAGLYQVNVAVPAASPTGSVPVVVIVGSATAQSAVTMYVN